MDARRALEVFGALPPRAVAGLLAAGRRLPGDLLAPGLYLGRNAGMPRPLKWAARRIVGRDFFAKLVLDDGAGVNVRCVQDGSHALRAGRGGSPPVAMDLPFRADAAGLDYALHLLGVDLPHALVFRDVLRTIELDAFAAALPPAHPARHGGERPGEGATHAAGGGAGPLVLGIMAPLGFEALAGLPFAMVRARDASPEEERLARALHARRRLLDTSGRGPGAARARG